ncbi:HD domain-containing protein [Paenibacillus sp. FSL H7-0331]|uniref:HD domain-containing protein n=1 Tax=Paenibacillus sp. FSL H7-0331 TaxID=1920421 RepID=UPI00097013C3|nr:HD domain-containing protein [Paenibacillus sp. FSL H7-0331]OMF11340.1 hypothetical protein BK127_25390 [Paenibacillus sp. FSL H7-0331]
MKQSFPFVRMVLPEWFMLTVYKVWSKMNDDATGHDFLHAVRVMELADEIARQLGADRSIAMTAGLLHDYYRKEEKQTGRLHYGLEAINGLRLEFGPLLMPALEEEQFERVIDAIARHEWYGKNSEPGGSELSLDAQILQDADRLEAIGAVGVARTFMFGGAHGLPMAEDEALPKDAWFDPNIPPKGSVYRHFYEKLLHLADGMHTVPGQKLAASRHQFIVLFLEQFEGELALNSQT